MPPRSPSQDIKQNGEEQPKNRDSLGGALACSPLFSQLSDATQNIVLERATIQDYVKGKTLFLQDEAANTLFVILSGWVKLYRETLDGTEAIVDILTMGHAIGDTAIFNADRYQQSAEVVEDARILCIPVYSFKRALEADTALAMNMLTVLSRYRHRHEIEIEHRTLQNAPQRIGCFLLRLCPPQAKGSVALNLPYDKTLIAARLGMQPETFSRALSKLKEDIGMSVHGATLDIPSLAALIEYACGSCSSSYPCQELMLCGGRAKCEGGCASCSNNGVKQY